MFELVGAEDRPAEMAWFDRVENPVAENTDLVAEPVAARDCTFGVVVCTRKDPATDDWKLDISRF